MHARRRQPQHSATQTAPHLRSPRIALPHHRRRGRSSASTSPTTWRRSSTATAIPAIVAAVTKQLKRGTAHTLATESRASLRGAPVRTRRQLRADPFRQLRHRSRHVRHQSRKSVHRAPQDRQSRRHLPRHLRLRRSQPDLHPRHLGPPRGPRRRPRRPRALRRSVLDDVVVVPFNDTDLEPCGS